MGRLCTGAGGRRKYCRQRQCSEFQDFHLSPQEILVCEGSNAFRRSLVPPS